MKIQKLTSVYATNQSNTELKRSLEEENQTKAALASAIQAARADNENLREQYEEEQNAKLELTKVLSKVNAELQELREKYWPGLDVVEVEDLDDSLICGRTCQTISKVSNLPFLKKKTRSKRTNSWNKSVKIYISTTRKKTNSSNNYKPKSRNSKKLRKTTSPTSTIYKPTWKPSTLTLSV